MNVKYAYKKIHAELYQGLSRSCHNTGVVRVMLSSRSGRVLIKNRRRDLTAHESHGRESVLIAIVQSSVRRSRDRAHVGRHVVSSRGKS
jgi:hypothetical protein